MDFLGGLITGLIEGATKAALLIAQGKLEEAKNAAFATIDEAQAKRLEHEKKHAERDAEMRSSFDPVAVTDPKGSSER